MSGQKGGADTCDKITPQLALLLIEEGFAVQAQDTSIPIEPGLGDSTEASPKFGIYQRNPGIDYFSFRKWRRTENYTIQTEKRDKVYCVSQGEPVVYTREELLEKLEGTEITIIPPRGHRYKPPQIRQIQNDIKRISAAISKFLNSAGHN